MREGKGKVAEATRRLSAAILEWNEFGPSSVLKKGNRLERMVTSMGLAGKKAGDCCAWRCLVPTGAS